jgi:hypothetical protein
MRSMTVMRILRMLAISTVFIAACGEVKAIPDAPGNIDGPGGIAPPTDVVATANVDLGARITWTASAGPITGYTVTASPAGGSSIVSGTSAVVTGLTAGESYTFTVTATDAASNTATSDASNSVTIVAGPAAPTSLIACGANTQATIRASASGAASYNIYFSADAGVSKLSPDVVSTATLPYVHTGLTNGTELHYTVTAVDDSGIESADAMFDSTTPDSAVRDMLFGHSFSATYRFLETIDCLSKYPDGATGAGRKVEGASTEIVQSSYNNLVVDAANAVLYYRIPTAILIFADATRVDGNTPPTRKITSSALTAGRGIALDTTRNLLYVGNEDNSILVFANAATANGTVNPVRTITSAAMATERMLVADTVNDRLYVANQGNVLVFNNASIANGGVTPARTITVNDVSLTTNGVALDLANNLLYIASRNSQTIMTVTATANGAVSPLRTIGGISTPMGIALVDQTLFTFSDSATRINSWANPTTVTGAVPPATVLFPSLRSGGGFAYAP